MPIKYTKSIIYLLISMYLAGIIGLNIPASQSLFQSLTPFNLITSCIIIILFQLEKNKSFLVFIFICFLFGFFIEVIGVNTGKIFGVYTYHEVLGLKLWNTPLLIGLNWLMITTCTGNLIAMRKVIGNKWFKAALGALIMAFFDVLAEPTAIRLNMWSWQNENPPFQNYVAWFIASYFLLVLFFSFTFKKENPVSGWILLLQFLFFGIQYLIY